MNPIGHDVPVAAVCGVSESSRSMLTQQSMTANSRSVEAQPAVIFGEIVITGPLAPILACLNLDARPISGMLGRQSASQTN